jgi:thiamine-phosphate pyrophosphorylase
LRESLAAGLRAVQVREKDLPTRPLLDLAREVRVLTREYGARLFVNDRLDIALAVEADGVQLRADSMPVAAARRLLGPERLIGVSAHSAAEARRAEAEGADFVLLGPIYATPSKLAYGAPIGLEPLAEAAQQCRLPVFAIGGITAARLDAVHRAGARGAAVISAILSAESVAVATRELLDAQRGTRRES